MNRIRSLPPSAHLKLVRNRGEGGDAQDAASRHATPSADVLARDTLALILAGGRGSRLGALTAARAKPALPFGGRFRIIDFTLSNCVNSGISRIGVLTQYQSESLHRHLRDAWSPEPDTAQEFIAELPADALVSGGVRYRGTADAVFRNFDFIRARAPARVLVLAGDHVYRMDYRPMLEAHVRSRALVTVGCVEVPLAEASAFGVIEADRDNRVLGFEEKPRRPRAQPGRDDRVFASMGIYVFETAFLRQLLLSDALRENSLHDFGRDVIPAAIDSGRVYCHAPRDPQRRGQAAYWRDVGTIDAYWRTHLEFAAATPAFDPDDADWPMSCAAGARNRSTPRFDQSLRPARRSAAAGITRIAGDARIERSSLAGGIRIGAAARITDAVVLPGVQIGAGCIVRRAVIEEGCRLPAGLVIGIDPAADRRHYQVSPRGIVLVTRASLGQHDQPPSALRDRRVTEDCSI